MKNHWLNKKKTLSVEDVRLAKELESQGVEGVCEYNELADVEPSLSIEVKASPLPDAYNEITIGDGWCGIPTSNEIKIEGDFPPIIVTDCGAFCISGSSYPPPDSTISSITISNDWGSFEPGQTALAELDMEVGDGSIKYARETTIGIFTFKDAGELGVDIFSNGNKIGWLNNQGEKALKQWLNDKPTVTTNFISGNGNIYTVGIDPAVGNDSTYFFRKEVYPDYNKKSYDRNFDPYIIKIVSNEMIEVPHVGNYNVYQLNNKDIIPGSFILTAYVSGAPVQSENLNADGELPCDRPDRPAFYKVKLDHNTGIIAVSWVNSNITDNRRLSVCYEYKDYKVKESKVC